MGLFGKRESSRGVEAEPPSTPPSFSGASIDMAAAGVVVVDLCNAIADHDRSTAAVSRLMSASGMPDPDNAHAVLAAHRREGMFASKRLWYWLVAVSKHANEVGAPETAVRAYWWGTHWINAIEPTLTGSNHIVLGFDKAPSGTHAALVEQAQRALLALPDDYVIAMTAEPATITAGPLKPIVDEQMRAGGDLPVDQAVMRLMNAAQNG